MALDAQAFAEYVAHKLPDASGIEVAAVSRIHGGASRETYRLRLSYARGDERVDRPLIVRKDPPASLIDTDREVEFAAYRAFRRTRVPVPEALWLENDSKWLGGAFFVMQEIEGFEASPQLVTQPPYSDHASKLGEHKWTILGEIALADPFELGLDRALEPVEPADCWRRELDYWVAKLDRDAGSPQPIMQAVIRRLRRNPPPPPGRLGVVHGDYRTGNFLYDSEGAVHAVLDWEMVHLGDPLEDLAWSLNRVFHWARDERAGGLLPRAEAIAIWERSAGRKADPAALRWWELFNTVKGQAIWLAAGKEFIAGDNRDPVLAIPGLIMANSQDRAALELLGKLA
ncbi:MAG: phosphotransferase family protein [Myxococcota bacterium]|nr:phosphotransferase family protein [Myxococcota bacterium]